MNAPREGHLIGCRVDLANSTEVAAGVGAAVGYLGCAVESGAAANDDGTDRLAIVNPAGELGNGAAVEIEITAREAERGFVEKAWREDVSFTEADDLFAQGDVDERERIACGRM